jgi:large repetitive protein
MSAGWHQNAFSQACTSFNLNFTGKPDTIWTSVPVSRNGQCCGATQVSIQFTVTLDSRAQGIDIDITGGTGNTNYNVGCSGSMPLNGPICLTGVGPHTITVWKPGNNPQIYTLKSYSKPMLVSKSIPASNSCPGTLQVKGFLKSTVSWNAIGSSSYNSYLSCTTGCDSIIVRPPATPPVSFVDYVVSGKNILSNCDTSTFRDTVRVMLYSNPVVSAGPKNSQVCNVSSQITLTAAVQGGLPTYSYFWSTGASTSSIVAGPGVYIVSVRDSLKCFITSDTVIVGVLPSVVVNAGNDTSICSNGKAMLKGTVINASGGKWSGGAGSYTPNDSTLNADYFPSAAEISAGFVNLILTSKANGNCATVKDTVKISILQAPVPVISGTGSICQNNTASYSTPSNPGRSYRWTVTGGTINSGQSTNSISVTWGTAGTGTLTVMDSVNSTGCKTTTSNYNVTINPNPTPVISGTGSLCALSTASYSTPSNPGRSYRWTISGGTINSGQSTNSISVTWGAAGTGTLTVMDSVNSTGCKTTTSNYNVTINPNPTPAITGNVIACDNDITVYHNPNGSGFSNTWTISGGTISSGSGTNNISVVWSGAGQKNVTLLQTNPATGCSAQVVLPVTVNPKPVTSSIFH